MLPNAPWPARCVPPPGTRGIRETARPVPHDSAAVWWPAFMLTAYGWRAFFAMLVCTVRTMSGRMGAVNTAGRAAWLARGAVQALHRHEGARCRHPCWLDGFAASSRWSLGGKVGRAGLREGEEAQQAGGGRRPHAARAVALVAGVRVPSTLAPPLGRRAPPPGQQQPATRLICCAARGGAGAIARAAPIAR